MHTRWMEGPGLTYAARDIWLNAWASWLLGRVEALGGAGSVSSLREPWGTWNSTAVDALISAAERARRNGGDAYSGLEDIAAVYLAMGTDWTEPKEDQQVRRACAGGCDHGRRLACALQVCRILALF